MELITILNRCHRFQGFVYHQARFSPNKKSIEVSVRPRKGSAAICSRCHQPAPGYDQLGERRFEFIPLWGFFVFLLYAMRRVDCRRCGAVVGEEVPWGDGKRTLTKAYMLFLARWARRLSWKETAEAFRPSWEKAFDAVEHVVTWGLEHRTLGQIDAIGVDEIQYAKGHKYLTLVYQIDIGVTRLLWVGKERTIESFQGFFTAMGQQVISNISFICSDMWEPYLTLIREKCSEALHILVRSRKEAVEDTQPRKHHGLFNDIRFYDRMDPRQRVYLDRVNSSVVIATAAPSVKRYLDGQHRLDTSAQGQVLLAELITEAVCREIARQGVESGKFLAPEGSEAHAIQSHFIRLQNRYAHLIHDVIVTKE